MNAVNQQEQLKTRILIVGLSFLSFGLGNFLLIFFYYWWHYDVPLVLLVPFGGNFSGNMPEPLSQVLFSNEILEDMGQRIGTSITIMDFNNEWPFSIWEMSWSVSFYLGMVLLPMWFYKHKKHEKENEN